MVKDIVKFDQHYLNNDDLLKFIVSSSKLIDSSNVLEVGCGRGSLTDYILLNARRCVGIEIDDGNVSFLKEKFSNEILSGKFILKKGSFNDFLRDNDVLGCRVCISNIPYSITEPFYSFLLDCPFDEVLVLHGRSFFFNLSNKNSFWNLFVKSRYSFEEVRVFEGNAFDPPTKVSSSLVRLVRKESLSKFDKFLISFFKRRFQKLRNSLAFSCVDIGYRKRDVFSFLDSLNLDYLNERVSRVNSDDIVNLIFLIRKEFSF